MSDSKPSLRDQILSLREEGFSYNAIKSKLGCAISTISYHCSEGGSEWAKSRVRKHRSTKKGKMQRKLCSFRSRICEDSAERPTNKKPSKCKKRHNVRSKMSTFKRSTSTKNRKRSFGKVNNIEKEYGIKELLEKLGDNPRCYLTGDQINLEDSASYNFDHIVPVSKGGTNDLSNLGICTKSANAAKNDLTEKQFVALCKKVLVTKGYYIKKINSKPKKKKV